MLNNVVAHVLSCLKVSQVGESAEMVANGSNGFVHPAGKEGQSQLAEAIVTLAKDRSLSSRFGTQGWQTVREAYGEKQFTDKLGKALRKVLDSRSAKFRGKRKKRVKLVTEVV